eukprot:354318-Chlamydomonas_euryale.AAC.18
MPVNMLTARTVARRFLHDVSRGGRTRTFGPTASLAKMMRPTGVRAPARCASMLVCCSVDRKAAARCYADVAQSRGDGSGVVWTRQVCLAAAEWLGSEIKWQLVPLKKGRRRPADDVTCVAPFPCYGMCDRKPSLGCTRKFNVLDNPCGQVPEPPSHPLSEC